MLRFFATPLGIIVAISLAVGILLLIRQIVCWYYKLNEIVDLLVRQNALLEELLDRTPRPRGAAFDGSYLLRIK